MACDGTDIDKALVLAEGQLKGFLGCIVFGYHCLVFLGIQSILGVVVKNDGTTGINGEHGLVAHSVAACECCPFALLLGALSREDILVAFLDERVCACCDRETDGIECALEVQEFGLGADDSVDEAEGCGLWRLDRRDSYALADRIDFDVYIRTDVDCAAIFSLCLSGKLVELECLDSFFRESDETADIHFYDYVFHLHLFCLLLFD